MLGPAKIPSPLPSCRFDTDARRVRVELDDSEFEAGEGTCFAEFEVAGPRERIYFDSSKVKAAIVTCGGLCPGLNDVIRAIVMAVLPPADQRLLHLLGIEEKSVKEVAGLTGLTRVNVKVRAYRARRKLRAFLEKEYE